MVPSKSPHLQVLQFKCDYRKVTGFFTFYQRWQDRLAGSVAGASNSLLLPVQPGSVCLRAYSRAMGFYSMPAMNHYNVIGRSALHAEQENVSEFTYAEFRVTVYMATLNSNGT